MSMRHLGHGGLVTENPLTSQMTYRRQIYRDYLRKKAVSINDPEAWDQYRQGRNQTNNAIKKAKRT